MSANYNPELARIKRPQRQIIGPAQQFVNDEIGEPEIGPPSASGQYLGGSGFVSEQRSPVDVTTGGDPGEAETQDRARDDGTSAPTASKQYINAYMEDPEWKAAHAAEDDVVEKLAPGIGNMILDRLTRGAYSKHRFAQLDASRLRKREIEKRYLDIANLERQTIVDNQLEMDGLNKNTAANMDYAKDKQELEDKRVASKYLPDTAEAALAQAQANVDRTVAGTEAVRAGTVAGKYMNVPANTNLVNARPDGTAVTVATGPNKEFNQNTGNSSRDYGEVTGNAAKDIYEGMRKTRDAQDWSILNPDRPNPYEGKSDEDLARMAKARASQLSGHEPPAPAPSAGSQYTNPFAAGTGIETGFNTQAGPTRQRLKLGPNGELIR